MTILRISRAFFPVIDGAAQHVSELSRAQVALGHSVWLLQPHVTAWPTMPGTVSIRRTAIGPLLPYVYGSKLVIAVHGVAASRAAADIAASTAIDVVHAHGDAIDAATIGAWARRRRLPFVLTIHGALNTGRTYARWAAPLFRPVDRFIVVSVAVRRQLAMVGVDPARVHVISSGVDVSRFAPRPPRVANGRPLHLVSVGRLHRVKGYPYLLQALRLLRTSGVEATLTVAGDGPEREAIAAEAAGLADVRLLGERSTAEIAQLLADADVFVMPSADIGTQAEGTPTAILEAMAAGLPIVCTDSGGMPHLVRHEEHGLVVPQRNPEALARALAALARDPRLRALMGSRGRALAATRDWRATAAAIDEVYCEAIAARQDRSGRPS